jgi:hypothetical protein
MITEEASSADILSEPQDLSRYRFPAHSPKSFRIAIPKVK